MNKKVIKFIGFGLLIMIFLFFISIIYTQHEIKEHFKELENKQTNIYCLASIKCENRCNQDNKENFFSCRYKCMTLKNCD